MKATIYHNTRCSKSRCTLDILREKQVETEVIDYLKNPPNKETLTLLLNLLNLHPRELMRKNEDEYKELGLDNPDLSQEQLITAMVDHPILIERPIVVINGQAVIGRPPEKVLEIIKTC